MIFFGHLKPVQFFPDLAMASFLVSAIMPELLQRLFCAFSDFLVTLIT